MVRYEWLNSYTVFCTSFLRPCHLENSYLNTRKQLFCSTSAFIKRWILEYIILALAFREDIPPFVIETLFSEWLIDKDISIEKYSKLSFIWKWNYMKYLRRYVQIVIWTKIKIQKKLRNVLLLHTTFQIIYKNFIIISEYLVWNWFQHIQKNYLI